MSGCYRPQTAELDQYLALLDQQQVIRSDPRVDGFIALYNGLATIPVAESAEKIYGESLFFNDTLVTLHSREILIAYLETTQQQLHSINVQVLQTFGDQENVFVQWKMTTEFQVLGKTRLVNSAGISHLRFDEAGKIILHQDFWDSRQGLFEHIPILGGILQWITEKFHS